MIKVNIAKKIGGGYGKFWKDKTHRYIVVKGGRGSKKSKTTALWIIYNMMKYPDSNTLVIRRAFNKLADSCWTELKWAVNQLQVSHLWNFSKAPLKATYTPTGQVILFRGLDDPLSVTSITVEHGYLCWAWFEEAYQIESEEAFNKVDMSIRGQLPSDLFFRLMITFNPWSEHHWLKKRFFDDPDEMTLTFTTTYMCNEWIGEQTIRQFEIMKERQFRRYRVEGLGDWGISEGLVFNDWEEREFDTRELLRKGFKRRTGMDLGFVDPSTVADTLYDKENNIIYVFNEAYMPGTIYEDIAKKLISMELKKQKIYMDQAQSRDIDFFKRQGFNAVPCIKGGGSVDARLRFLQNAHIVVHPRCENLIMELRNFAYKKDKNDNYTDATTHEYSHLIDALGYAYCDIYTKGDGKAFKISSFGF